MPGGLRSASLHSGPSHRFAAGPSPYTCPGVDKPPGTPYPSLKASGGHFFMCFREVRDDRL